MKTLKIEELSKNFGSTEVLKKINLEIDEGNFLVLLGPSGCGKSTLLNIIAGLETINEGDVFIDDYNVSKVEPKDRNIAMVFQSYALYPSMNVKENMIFGLKQAKTSKEKIQEIEKSLPELPEQKIVRFIKDYKISEYESKNLNASRELSNFFEKVAKKISSPDLAAKWILGDLMAILNKNNSEIQDSKISSEDMINLLCKIEEGSLSGPGAKKIIELCWSSSESIDVLIKKEGLDALYLSNWYLLSKIIIFF